MTPEETLYRTIGLGIKDATESQMFGKPCFKIGSKAFIAFFRNEMVFKLMGDSHKEAIQLSGATLFDPSGKQRPMKEWVQVPFTHQEKWNDLAQAAMRYAGNLKHTMQ